MKRSHIILFTVLTLLAASCDKKKMVSVYDSQAGNIEKIITSLTKSNTDATVEMNKGTTRVTVSQGEGAPLDENGAVAFYYAGYYISGGSLSSSNLFATNHETFAESVGWSLSDSSSFNITTLKLGEDDIVEGLRNGLVGVKGGDECYVLFDGRHGFGKKKIGNVPANAALAYHLWVKSVSND